MCVCLCVCVSVCVYMRARARVYMRVSVCLCVQGPVLVQKGDYAKPLEHPLMFLCAACLGVCVQAHILKCPLVLFLNTVNVLGH